MPWKSKVPLQKNGMSAIPKIWFQNWVLRRLTVRYPIKTRSAGANFGSFLTPDRLGTIGSIKLIYQYYYTVYHITDDYCIRRYSKARL